MENREQFARVMAGAAIGAGFAFLFLTKRGHRFLNAAEPWMDDVIRDLQRLRGAAAKARDAVEEGRRSFDAITNLSPFGTSQGSWSSEARH